MGVKLQTVSGGSVELVGEDSTVDNVVEIPMYGFLGVGQTWQDMTASRVRDTTYTNDTGKPIMVYITLTGGSDVIMKINVDGISFGAMHSGVSQNANVSAIIPPNSSYKAVVGSSSIQQWVELR